MMNSKRSRPVVSLPIVLTLFSPLMVLTGQAIRENAVPLKNWVTPLFWQANQREEELAAKVAPKIQLSANAASTTPLAFVAITPCRLVDTRGAAAGFNGIPPFSGPSIPGGGTLTIPVQSTTEAAINTAPAPCGVIPAIAQAYSFNVTVVPAADGGVDYLSIWAAGFPRPAVANLNDAQGLIVGNATIVSVGTPFGGVSVYNAGPAATDVVIDMNGYFAATTDLNGNTAAGAGALASNTTGTYNTAGGADALQNNTVGSENTATGVNALQDNITGEQNTAVGWDAMSHNTSGNNNMAIGAGALQFNTAGAGNTATGSDALDNNTIGSNNMASGSSALSNNTLGSNNTAIGAFALEVNTTGNNNIAIGQAAALHVLAGNNNNIHIGSVGDATDNGTIRIGTLAAPQGVAGAGTQTSFFVAGVRGITPGNSDFVPVVIDSNGQLGTVSSSRRFKEDIENMNAASDDLMRLRPVTFRYKKPFSNGSKPLQYGLIAEEVADVYPDLVTRSADGLIETVKYQVLDSMLLNELQKEHRQLEQQSETIQHLEVRLAALEQTLASKTASLIPPGR